VYSTQIGGRIVLQYVSDGLPIICSLISVLCLISVYKEFKLFDFTKSVWLLILIGIALFFIAETLYAIFEIVFKQDMNEIFPSYADYIWCIGYIPIFIGLIMMFLGYKKSGFPMGNKNQYIVISSLIFIIIISVIVFLLVPIINDTETTTFAKIFYLFYPIADLLVVIPAIILMYITSLFGKGAISKPWMYLAIGFISFTIADLLYSYLSWLNLYGNGNLIDLTWNFGYLAVGLAGLYQKELLQSLNSTTK
jgi:hypothetical protein